MKFPSFIDPGGSQEPPAIAPGVAVRASMEIFMDVVLAKADLDSWEWGQRDDDVGRAVTTLMRTGADAIIDQLAKDFSGGPTFFVDERGHLLAMASSGDHFEIVFDLTTATSDVGDPASLAEAFEKIAASLRWQAK